VETLLVSDLLPIPDLETSGSMLVCPIPVYEGRADDQTEGTYTRSPDPTLPVRSSVNSYDIILIPVLSGATVGKALLSSGSSPRATGVEFRDQSGTTYTANARREVIIATGSIKTPVILQQSGIGPAFVLSAAGVTQRVDLPVGMNLIDQTTTSTSGSFRNSRGGGQPITFPRFQVCFIPHHYYW
jgi:hypothetical protein